jgi:plastocyanin
MVESRASKHVSSRGIWMLIGAILMIGATVTCHGSNNAMTNPNPNPLPVGTPVPNMTPTPSAQMATVNVGQGGTNFVDQQGGGSTTTIRAGSTVRWVWVNSTHSTTSGICSGTGQCTPDGIWDSGVGTGITFSRTFSTPGTFHYFCRVHDAMMQGIVVVQ